MILLTESAIRVEEIHNYYFITHFIRKANVLYSLQLFVILFPL